MAITSKADSARQFSTLIATGEISSSEIVDAFKSFYNKQYSNNVLWDFRCADLEALLSSGDLENITISLAGMKLKSQGLGKTAIVASTDVWFSLARMYVTFSEINNLSDKIQVFRSMDEAIKWLVSKP